MAILVAVGVDADGFRQVLGVMEGMKEDKDSWAAFLRSLKERGLRGVKLFISDKCVGLAESLADFYPERTGNGAWCIFTATFSRWCRVAR